MTDLEKHMIARNAEKRAKEAAEAAKSAQQTNAAKQVNPVVERKYELTAESDGYGAFRIRALRDFDTPYSHVRKGELGGFATSLSNLSHKGGCWLYGNSKSVGRGFVGGNACAFDNAVVEGRGILDGNAKLSGKASVEDQAHVHGNASVSGSSAIRDISDVSGDAIVVSTTTWGDTVIQGAPYIDGCSLDRVTVRGNGYYDTESYYGCTLKEVVDDIGER